MRYLVRAKVRSGLLQPLLGAIDDETLGRGSVAEGEYLRNMKNARLMGDGTVRWVEICYCPTPLLEERPYWEQFFELYEVPGENISFGRGLAQRAHISAGRPSP